jgi:hypothetical protein
MKKPTMSCPRCGISLRTRKMTRGALHHLITCQPKDSAPGRGTEGAGSGENGVQPAQSASTGEDKPPQQPATTGRKMHD